MWAVAIQPKRLPGSPRGTAAVVRPRVAGRDTQPLFGSFSRTTGSIQSAKPFTLRGRAEAQPMQQLALPSRAAKSFVPIPPPHASSMRPATAPGDLQLGRRSDVRRRGFARTPAVSRDRSPKGRHAEDPGAGVREAEATIHGRCGSSAKTASLSSLPGCK